MTSTAPPSWFIYTYVCVYLNMHMEFWLSGSSCPMAINVKRTNITSSMKSIAQYKTVYSWSLLLLHNTVGGVLWVGETSR